jgi:hypothetical protein
MVLIFGWGAGDAKDMGEVAPVVCPNCHNNVLLHHLRSQKTVRLYFVPVVPYGSNEYLACPICHSGLQLQASQGPAVTRMKAATSAFRRGVTGMDLYRAEVDQFWRTMGVAPSGQQVLRPPATVPPPSAPAPGPAAPAPSSAGGTGAPSVAQQLADLGRLYADGVLTEAEFTAAKRRILEG